MKTLSRALIATSAILSLVCLTQQNAMAVDTNAATSDEKTRIIRFGVVPQQSASKLARLWTPILEYLGHKTGYQFIFGTAPDIPEFENRLAAGKYDLSYMNPYHYTTFNQYPGYIAIARARNKKIRGIVVVRKDSLIDNIGELHDKTLAFPAPAAFAASVLPRAYFKQAGMAITPKYVGSHDSVYRTVSRGLYPAGGGVIRTFNNVDPSIRNQLRVLWGTQAYTPHALAMHPDVPENVRTRIQTALAGMHEDPDGKKLVSAIKLKGFEKAQNSDWDDVRSLNLHLLDGLIRK